MSSEATSPPPTGSNDDYTVDLTHDGSTVASARVVASPDPHGTATVAFQAHRREDLPPNSRGDLVDKVLDEPAVRNSDQLHAVLPLGDSESMAQLHQRTTDLSAHAAGASAIVDATILPTDGDAP